MADDPLAPYRQAIEESLRALTATLPASSALLRRMFEYQLGWVASDGAPLHGAGGGKRLRPILCLLCCEAVGGAWQAALPAAAAIELVHNFSLIHDDIEDDGGTRHGRPALWKVWGLAQALNTGDAMWALARIAVHELRGTGHSGAKVLSVVKLLDDAGLALCVGQFHDISFETAPAVTLAQYEQMVSGKTVALLRAATEAGAQLGCSDTRRHEQFATFGRELGLAFQVVDDLLGIWGDPRSTGKSALTDILTRKKTLPILLALAYEAERGLDDLQRLYADPGFGPDALPEVLRLLDRAGARAACAQRAQEHHERMRQALAATGLDNPAMDGLVELSEGLLGRTY